MSPSNPLGRRRQSRPNLILLVSLAILWVEGTGFSIFGQSLPKSDTFISDFKIQQPGSQLTNDGIEKALETDIGHRNIRRSGAGFDGFSGFPRSPFSDDAPSAQRRNSQEAGNYQRSSFGSPVSRVGSAEKSTRLPYQRPPLEQTEERSSQRQTYRDQHTPAQSESPPQDESVRYAMLNAGMGHHRNQEQPPPSEPERTDYSQAANAPDEAKVEHSGEGSGNSSSALKSKYSITVDGVTPFGLEDNSEILYDADGQPEEVVVYLDAEGKATDKPKDLEGSSGYCCYRHQGSYSKDKGHSGYSDHKGYGHDDHGYGHEAKSYGHDDHSGYGHDDHSSSGYGHGGGHSGHGGHGGYGKYHVPSKKPGPYGYGKPNFKCEYAKETLYVTKTVYKVNKKCFKVFKTDCKHVYDNGKGIGYKKECSEFSETKCRTVYDTNFKTKCYPTYKKVCDQTYTTKVDWSYKEQCTTSYDKECSGYGYHKHCHEVPREKCKQVPVKIEKKVPKTVCAKKPDKKCKDIPFFVPRKECKHFPKTVCVQDPINVKKSIPKKKCFPVPIEKCIKIPKEVLKHIPKTVKKKICVSTKVHHDGGYGHDDHGHSGGGYGHSGGGHSGGGHSGHGHSGHGHSGHGHSGGGYGHDDHHGHGGDGYQHSDVSAIIDDGYVDEKVEEHHGIGYEDSSHEHYRTAKPQPNQKYGIRSSASEAQDPGKKLTEVAKSQVKNQFEAFSGGFDFPSFASFQKRRRK
ncbi:uncharacterized protein LOC131885432 isoform X2 [Tigriopus californicus]|uniref:uncharacterized protein LOC131885432 isoform X2 n=1 Tax=Tigriopus californicus TaxID=6832 RepID=UPI0027D9E177|nr:uncharacterized protein LOC131885432 isoform X2 [Tigriopus californicus]